MSSADTTMTAALGALTETVISLPAVTGTAVGLCEGVACLQVFLSAPDSAALSNIPDTIDGRAVHVVVTGALERLDTVR